MAYGKVTGPGQIHMVSKDVPGRGDDSPPPSPRRLIKRRNGGASYKEREGCSRGGGGTRILLRGVYIGWEGERGGRL